MYVTDAISGRTDNTRLMVRVITNWAQSALFARNIFLRPSFEQLSTFSPDWLILHAPQVQAKPEDNTNGSAFIITDLANKTTIIGGTHHHVYKMGCVESHSRW